MLKRYFCGGQWLRLQASNAGGAGSIPGWGTKIPHAMWHCQVQNNGNINVEVISILTPKFNSRWKKAYIGG